MQMAFYFPYHFLFIQCQSEMDCMLTSFYVHLVETKGDLERRNLN